MDSKSGNNKESPDDKKDDPKQEEAEHKKNYPAKSVSDIEIAATPDSGSEIIPVRVPSISKHKKLIGHEEFRQYADSLTSSKITYFYFVGTKESSGRSWCSDCNAVEPIVEAAWEKYKDDNSEFINVDVGDRPTFKDKTNPFRLDKDTRITDIPTLVRWKTQRRLVNTQLLKNDLLEMFFTEDD